MINLPCPPKLTIPTAIKQEHTLKGCVHWFDLVNNTDVEISSQKARPYIIIGADNPRSNRIIISPISDRIHYVEQGTDILKYPYHAPLFKSNDSFLDKDSAILLDQVYTIKKDNLCEEWYMGKISDNAELDKAIMYNFDLFQTTFSIYKELFEQLQDKIKKEYANNYTRK